MEITGWAWVLLNLDWINFAVVGLVATALANSLIVKKRVKVSNEPHPGPTSALPGGAASTIAQSSKRQALKMSFRRVEAASPSWLA